MYVCNRTNVRMKTQMFWLSEPNLHWHVHNGVLTKSRWVLVQGWECSTTRSSRSVTSFAPRSRFWNSPSFSFIHITGTKIPFSAGAYSYIPVGGLDAQARLAQPLEDTLFSPARPQTAKDITARSTARSQPASAPLAGLTPKALA